MARSKFNLAKCDTFPNLALREVCRALRTDTELTAMLLLPTHAESHSGYGSYLSAVDQPHLQVWGMHVRVRLIEDGKERRWAIEWYRSLYNRETRESQRQTLSLPDQWNQLPDHYKSDLSEVFCQRVMNRVSTVLKKVEGKTGSNYVSRWLNRGKCIDNRLGGAMSVSRTAWSEEGRVLEDRAIEFLGDKPLNRGFLKDGTMWLRFVVGPWTMPDRYRRNYNTGVTKVTPGKPRAGISLDSLGIFHDMLEDEGIQSDYEQEKVKEGNWPSVKLFIRP